MTALRRLLVGADPPAVVPERIRHAIAEAEARSEILVCWVQIAAIVTFAVLYSLAPKAFPPEVPFEPVPVALAAYSAFTELRLWLAWQRRLGPWFLSLSVIVDMAVLMVTIWSFHLQYQAPPELSLKAPTLMYAFILIALRALRFECRYVVLAGAAAALGWLAVIACAVLGAEAGTMPVTRSFTEYATSNKILLGAEFDKIISLLMVAAILAMVVIRARRLLTATAEHQAGLELARFFSPEVAATIKGAEVAIAPGEGELRPAAILFLDLRGFTRLSATMTPREVMRLLGEYQSRLVPVIQHHGGSIDKYLGDGILASFGVVRPSPTFAADALQAVDGLLAAAAAWRAEREAAGQPAPIIGAGLAVGTVMFGAIGSADRLEYTVIGDAVNLAAKLEAHTKVEECRALTTGEALELARAQGYVPPAAPRVRRAIAVAGVTAPVDVVLLDDAGSRIGLGEIPDQRRQHLRHARQRARPEPADRKGDDAVGAVDAAGVVEAGGADGDQDVDRAR
ncbi:MAG TPA: adenylate/guanylate cyclase domain-containing protein [Geminicoccaceae bacterium]|nr:adenylate/guanylate cyclase domain-containing protein [Geminicoccaceae bacterium]